MKLHRTSHLAILALSTFLVAAPAQHYAPPVQPDYQVAEQGNQDPATNQNPATNQDPASRVARISVVEGMAQSQHLRLDPNTQRQLAQAPILPHALVTPQQGAASLQIPARALPPNQNRPLVETRQGFERAGQPVQQQLAPTRQLAPRSGPVTQNGQDRQTRQPTNQPQPAPISQAPMVHTQPVYHQPIQAARQPMNPQAPAQAPGQIEPSLQPPPQNRSRSIFPLQRDHTPVTPGQPPVTQAAPPHQTQTTRQEHLARPVANSPAANSPAAKGPAANGPIQRGPETRRLHLNRAKRRPLLP